MQINLTNLKAGPYSLDLVINKDFEPVRILIAQGGTTDIGDLLTVDELNISEQLIAAVAAGDISIATVAEAADIDDPAAATNAADIVTNAAGIAANVIDIATNVSDIGTNVTDIGTNAADIVTNEADIVTNGADILQLQTDLSTLVVLPEIKTITQLVAATDDISAGVAAKAGVVTSISMFVDTICDAAEDFSVDVLLNGTSVLTGALTINTASGARTAVAATIDTAADDVAAGDVWTVEVTYTAGGAPTASGLCVSIETAVIDLSGNLEIKTVTQLVAATDDLSAGVISTAGDITGVTAFVDTACTGAETFTIDVFINGVSCLTAPFVVDSGDAARTAVAGAINVAADAVVATDVITVEVVYVAGGGTATGLCVSVVSTPTP